MLKQFLVILIFVCANLLAKGQLAKNSTLFLELKKQDSVFFERSFNLCDIEYLEQTIHQDLLFSMTKVVFKTKQISLLL